MKEPLWKTRVREERRELLDRIETLLGWLEIEGQLVVGKDEAVRMRAQLVPMTVYLEILDMRIKAWEK